MWQSTAFKQLIGPEDHQYLTDIFIESISSKVGHDRNNIFPNALTDEIQRFEDSMFVEDFNKKPLRIKFLVLKSSNEYDEIFIAIAENKNLNDQHFLSHLLEHFSDAIIITDAYHRVTFWNKKAEEIYGYRQSLPLESMSLNCSRHNLWI